ncbi:MAG: ParB N-terminal domain-containing protein [Pseudomonadota bacterium]|nr:ParB N-terminal domain-containing protein [Pseudomonadota bacterium]|tara:strand:- start:158 stop:403 length:246 start_codon:yes stop_codon:yes gene_type:complete
MDAHILPIDNIYVPVKRRATLNEETVKTLALEILEEGQKVPIQVRRDGSRFVLIEGLHRLEACRSLGENTITAFIVRARLH